MQWCSFLAHPVNAVDIGSSLMVSVLFVYPSNASTL